MVFIECIVSGVGNACVVHGAVQTFNDLSSNKLCFPHWKQNLSFRYQMFEFEHLELRFGFLLFM